MGFYVLCGLETDKKLKEMAKRYVMNDINKRRECIKALTFTGGMHIKNQLITYLHIVSRLISPCHEDGQGVLFVFTNSYISS